MTVDVATLLFYRRLYALIEHRQISPLLADVVELVVVAVGDATVYLELFDDGDGTPRHWHGHHCSDTNAQVIRTSISRGIIGRAIAEGRTVSTPSAVADRRFEDLDSVKQHELQAVLCVPVGLDWAIGALYAQRRQPAAFSTIEQEKLEMLAQVFSLIAERLTQVEARSRLHLTERIDHEVFETFRRHDNNVSAAAKELNVSRSYVYKAVARCSASVCGTEIRAGLAPIGRRTPRSEL